MNPPRRPLRPPLPPLAPHGRRPCQAIMDHERRVQAVFGWAWRRSVKLRLELSAEQGVPTDPRVLRIMFGPRGR